MPLRMVMNAVEMPSPMMMHILSCKENGFDQNYLKSEGNLKCMGKDGFCNIQPEVLTYLRVILVF